MMNNLIQMELYVREYCEITKLSWCDHEIVDFQKSISNFQRFAYNRAPNIDLIDHIDMMYEFSNEKCKYFVTLWTAFDFQAFYGGIVTGLWLVIFQVATVLCKPEAMILAPQMTALSVMIYSSMLFGWLDLSIAAVAIIGISILQSQKKFGSVVDQLTQTISNPENLRPKPLTYPLLIAICVLLLILYNFLDTMQQEGAEVTDTILLMILAMMWLSQPTHLRNHDIPSMIAIVLCIKSVYFIDHEQSMNFKTDPTLKAFKLFVSD